MFTVPSTQNFTSINSLPHAIIGIFLVESQEKAQKSEIHDNIADQSEITRSPLYSGVFVGRTCQNDGKGKRTDHQPHRYEYGCFKAGIGGTLVFGVSPC